MEEFIAIIKIFAGNFAPRGWILCAGQILPIQQYTAVFSLVGTTYGGNGQTTFGIPDLRGRTPVGAGQGPGLSSYSLGQTGGGENTVLNSNNLPLHVHSIGAVTVNAVTTPGSAVSPSGNYIAASRGVTSAGFAPTGTPAPLNAGSITSPGTTGSVGGNLPFDNRQPFLAINYIFCLEGIYPSRN